MAVQIPAGAPDRNGKSGQAGGGTGIKSQINLPWSKAITIAMNSLKIRLGRSLITASGIFLGIAFLTFSGTPILIKIAAHTSSTADGESNRQLWLVIMAL